MSPLQRSLRLLETLGYDLIRKVEVWNSFAHKRQDLWGYDVLAAGHGHLLFVQVTDGAHKADHLKALRASEATAKLLKNGAKCVLHSWRCGGPQGKRKTWAVTETVVDHAVTP